MSSLATSLVARLVASVVNFFTMRAISKTKNMNGSWVYEQITTESEYRPYIAMRLRYLALIRINGLEISGAAEKIWESSTEGGEREYTGKNRSTATISGHYIRNVFGKDEIVIHLNESGHGRNYSTQQIINFIDDNQLEGRFTSTAANQTGTCKWFRRTT